MRVRCKLTAAFVGSVLVTNSLISIFSPSASGLEIKAVSTPAQMLSALKVSAESLGGSYSRDAFQHWVDADGDGCDTRDEVLQQESKVKVSCNLLGGSWISAYDGVKTTNPSSFDIDHFIPLKEAWESGAARWNEGTRRSFANDLDYPLSLIAVTASSNRSKSDRDPAGWLPTLKTFSCQYIGTWVAVKYRWSLTIDATERRVVAASLSACGTKAKVPIPKMANIGLSSTPNVSASPAPTAPGSIHPRFASCAEAKRNGFSGPYTKGKNPEYEWYQDRDGDGVVCE